MKKFFCASAGLRLSSVRASLNAMRSTPPLLTAAAAGLLAGAGVLIAATVGAGAVGATAGAGAVGRAGAEVGAAGATTPQAASPILPTTRPAPLRNLRRLSGPAGPSEALSPACVMRALLPLPQRGQAMP